MLGIENLYPFSFYGETCEEYPQIKDLLVDAEAFNAQYGPEVWLPKPWM